MSDIIPGADSIKGVVENGLCIGCGLCEAMSDGRVPMVMTDAGSLRPSPADGFMPEIEALLLTACPGVRVAPRARNTGSIDPVWGCYSSMRQAWAGDPDVRFRASTGGVLSALGMHAVSSGVVEFVLHVAPDPEKPIRSTWTISETPQAVLAGAGSRYAPAAPLVGLKEALDRHQPFAIIAKPCDLSAVDNLSLSDPRVDQLCVLRFVMVCGGQSRLKKSTDLLSQLDLTEEEVTLFRHRGYGNPGRTRIETRDGRAFEKTYQELWADEAGWLLETRCKFCPDALGEAADVAAADVWPGGGPVGEDAGFNGIIVRTEAGEQVVASAVEAGDLAVGDAITPRQFDDLQPHQVRKKRALGARFAALAQSGLPVLHTPGLRLEELADEPDSPDYQREFDGTLSRIGDGRFREPQ